MEMAPFWVSMRQVIGSRGETCRCAPLTHACSGANVENATGLRLVDGRQVETPDEAGYDVVDEQQTFHLLLVVWPGVP